jgi:hypothetical protein
LYNIRLEFGIIYSVVVSEFTILYTISPSYFSDGLYKKDDSTVAPGGDFSCITSTNNNLVPASSNIDEPSVNAAIP